MPWYEKIRDISRVSDHMSESLLFFAESFLKKSTSPEIFVEEFMDRWKHERDNEVALLDSPKVSEVLFSIFCLVDLFNADDDRESYELDEVKLRAEIANLLGQAGFMREEVDPS